MDVFTPTGPAGALPSRPDAAVMPQAGVEIAKAAKAADVSELAGVATDAHYELRFESMFVEGRGLAFPCDAEGRVDIDRLSERARANYLYARAVVGREYRCPTVRRECRDWRELASAPRREPRH